MNTSPVIVNFLDEKVWREFVDQHPHGNIFHTPEMFRVFEYARGHQPKLWAALDDNNQLLALFLPVQVTLYDGVMRRLTTRSIAYGSVLCTPDSQGKEALAILLGKYAQEIGRNALYTELRHLSDPCDIQQVLDQSGYTFDAQLDYLIDLSRSEVEIWQGISKNGRKSIRKFQNKGVIHEEVSDRSRIPIFYSLLNHTYNRVRVPVADISLFEAVFDILVPEGMAKMLLARVQNNYVAASLEILYKDVIYSWYSGYDRRWRSVHPNDGLVWYILKWGSENGYRYYDFGGAGKPDETYSVRNFKGKYGGRLVNYGRHTCVHSPILMSVSRIGYQIYRNIKRCFHAIRTKSTEHQSSELAAG